MKSLSSKENKLDDLIIVVSGLPRSGTSMMMKMLEACNMPLLTDSIRQPDEDNPKGYYEFERVKDLEQDNSWFDVARGMAVKVVSPLLRYLNTDKKFRYKVIFMLRNIDEILSSQKKMANRLSHEEDNIEENILRQNYFRHLEEVKDWLRQNENIEVMYVSYADVINDPLPAAENIAAFLGINLDIHEMAGIIDNSLYRNRTGQSHDSTFSAALEQSDNYEIIMDRLKQLGYL